MFTAWIKSYGTKNYTGSNFGKLKAFFFSSNFDIKVEMGRLKEDVIINVLILHTIQENIWNAGKTL